MNTAAARTTVSCSCKVCKVNAEKVGAPFPLEATVPAAHNPGAMGRAMRARLSLAPVAA